MQESAEVREAVLGFYERISAGDVEGTAATIADDPDAFVIGTQRIGPGREQWIDSVAENAQMGIRFEAGPLRAWQIGADAGWAVDEPRLVLPNGLALTARMTAVLRREGETFRLLNMHYSWSVPDEVALEHAPAWREQLAAPA